MNSVQEVVDGIKKDVIHMDTRQTWNKFKARIHTERKSKIKYQNAVLTFEVLEYEI